MASHAALKRALQLMKRRADYEYFFSRLTTAEWLQPIDEEGLFAHPPAAIRQGNYVQFPFWPESEYLARVASEAPSVAGRILRSIPETDNLRVHHDLADVALSIGRDDASKWAMTEATWLSRQEWVGLMVPSKLSELIAKLATIGEKAAAVQLTHALFEVRPDPRASTMERREGEFRFPPEPRAKYDMWEYGKALERVVPTLAKAIGVEAVRVFSQLLQRALELSQSERGGPPADYSFIWRDAIEHGALDDHDVKNALISAVRDSAESAARTIPCAAVVGELESHAWDVFRRIGLHVIRVSCGSANELIRPRLISSNAFRDSAVHHEYAMLLQHSFGGLAEADKQIVLEWIEAGPNREAMRERHLHLSGEQLTSELETAWVEQWQRDRLSPIRDALSPQWRARFDDVVERHGAPEFDFNQHKTTAVSWGASSPVTLDHIRSLAPDDLRRFLTDWVPEASGPRAPSREGVVMTLQGLGDDFFQRDSENAEKWRGIHPAYVAIFLTALVRVTKAGNALAWRPVLRLMAEIADVGDADTDSVWVKRCAADLLLAGLDSASAARIPASDESLVWLVLEALIRAAHREVAGSIVAANVDSLTGAINSISGKALEALVRYAVWKKRQAHATDATWTLRERLPSVEQMLEEWVSPSSTRLVDSRSIFGLELGPLLWLDRVWVERHLADLFPSDSKYSRQRDAVWDTYLIYCSPFGNALDLLKPEYERSVNSLSAPEMAVEGTDHLRRRLAEHLMAYCWQGYLTHTAEGDLLAKFFDIGDVKVRSHAIDFVGRSLRRDEDIPPDPVQRLISLFEWRLAQISTIEDSGERTRQAGELSPYGWWFASAKFDAQWSLKALIAVLRLAGTVEPDHMVAERLLELVGEHSSEVATALLLMVQAPSEHHSVVGWREEARAILEHLLVSKEEGVILRARDTVNALLERRFQEFRNLLPKDASPS